VPSCSGLACRTGQDQSYLNSSLANNLASTGDAAKVSQILTSGAKSAQSARPSRFWQMGLLP
jgi:hypothetical protein